LEVLVKVCLVSNGRIGEVIPSKKKDYYDVFFPFEERRKDGNRGEILTVHKDKVKVVLDVDNES